MKSIWLTICVIAPLYLTQAKPNEPGETQTPAAHSMRGKEVGQIRDDNGLEMKLVWCPPGKFTMGSPEQEDQVDVTLTKGFWLGKFEVTQSEWKQVMQTEPWKGLQFTKEGMDFPATFVSWMDAAGFCRKLTEQERKAGRLSNDWEYTLPTEAEWERACRAGTETRFSFGDDNSKLGEYAWFLDNAWTTNKQFARRVGEKKANPWGFHDMHGNVWEWCRDVYAEELPGGRDPEVKADEKAKAAIRVFRGGSWLADAVFCGSGLRSGYRPPYPFSFGFRVALSSVQ